MNFIDVALQGVGIVYGVIGAAMGVVTYTVGRLCGEGRGMSVAMALFAGVLWLPILAFGR